MQVATKRLSVRSVANLFGLPPRVVSRAISNGDLFAVATVTETGRERFYVSENDAITWFNSLSSSSSTSLVGEK